MTCIHIHSNIFHTLSVPRRSELNYKLLATAGWPRLVSPRAGKTAKVSKNANLPPQCQSKHLSLLPVKPSGKRSQKMIEM